MGPPELLRPTGQHPAFTTALPILPTSGPLHSLFPLPGWCVIRVHFPSPLSPCHSHMSPAGGLANTELRLHASPTLPLVWKPHGAETLSVLWKRHLQPLAHCPAEMV